MADHDTTTCPHGRLPGACEDCAYDDAKAAGLPVYPVSPEETRKRNQRLAALVTGDDTPAPSTRARKAR